jgi:hypothetical protein
MLSLMENCLIGGGGEQNYDYSFVDCGRVFIFEIFCVDTEMCCLISANRTKFWKEQISVLWVIMYEI